MIKKILIIIIILIMVAVPIVTLAAPEGFTVIKEGDLNLNSVLVQYRLRDLGYLAYRPTGRFGSMSVKAVKNFQSNNNLQSNGQIGTSTFDKLFENGLARSTVKTDLIMYGNSEDDISNTGDPIPWDSVSKIFVEGKVATIYDTKSDATFKVKRVGGEGHAHVEPLTAEDTEGFYDMFTKTEEQLEYIRNGRLTYEKRPCAVEINDKLYAASLFGYVHGDEPEFIANPDDPEQSIEDNNMTGYLCLYFSGSTTDIFGLNDFEHDKAIEVASQ